MARQITQRELRNDSAAILRAVAEGEMFILTRNGTPIAEVRPLRRRAFVSRAELAEAAPRMARIDPARFRADVDPATQQTLLGE
jgi:prevent-host-death family protein